MSRSLAISKMDLIMTIPNCRKTLPIGTKYSPTVLTEETPILYSTPSNIFCIMLASDDSILVKIMPSP